MQTSRASTTSQLSFYSQDWVALLPKLWKSAFITFGRPIGLLSVSTSVRSLRSLATPNGDAQSRLSQPNGFEPFSHDRQYDTKSQMLSLQLGTKTQSIAKLQLTKRNVVKLGGELASDQRLSGLARERSERARPSEATKCPLGAVLLARR